MTNGATARWLGVNKSTVGRWGKEPPRMAAMLLDMLAKGELPERFRPTGERK